MRPPPQTIHEIYYHLPPEAIAQQPLAERDAARLLVDDGSQISHSQVVHLPSLLEPSDLVVVNNTRVLRARLPLRRASGGAVEVLLLEQVDQRRWQALVRPSRKLSEGEVVFNERLSVTIGEVLEQGRRIVTPNVGKAQLLELLDEVGLVPLPPYIESQIKDPERYQTVFAKRPLSAAAPTAGLHLSHEVLAQLAAKGVRVATVELAIGLDTFRPLAVERLDDHVMHSEWYSIPDASKELIEAAKRVVAVGTTTTRALEAWGSGGPSEGRTDLFIRRGFEWSLVDVMLTNFHLPESTLLCMIDAFIGDRWRDLYTEALAMGYRFLSFGDAMLITRRSLGASLP